MRLAVVGHIEWVEFIPVGRLPDPGQVVHAEGAFARAAGGGERAIVTIGERLDPLGADDLDWDRLDGVAGPAPG